MAYDFVDLGVEVGGRDAALCAGVKTRIWVGMVSLFPRGRDFFVLTIDEGS